MVAVRVVEDLDDEWADTGHDIVLSGHPLRWSPHDHELSSPKSIRTCVVHYATISPHYATAIE